MFSFKKIVVAMVVLAACAIIVDTCPAQEPGWTSKVLKRGEDRRITESTPILDRPYRPLHFYGNTVRRKHYHGRRRPTVYDLRMTSKMIRSR